MIICVKVKRGCFRNENDLRFFSEFVKFLKSCLYFISDIFA